MEFLSELFPTSIIQKEYEKLLEVIIGSRICVRSNVMEKPDLVYYIDLRVSNLCKEDRNAKEDMYIQLWEHSKRVSESLYSKDISEQISILSLNFIAIQELIELENNKINPFSNFLYFLSRNKRKRIAKEIINFTTRVIYSYRGVTWQ